ncbi:hypothetical protein [Klebsiella grimontii]|uniref:hypothetical protein n=1 Tax=Gammaproteobacteria TaxID=1236 RepID=UPI0011E4504A|nr:hypothetical protein [Klebsiella grimontii]MBS6571309.1 hypothetical protein [Klebsiella michiganensis]MDU4227483.1 hypothetical protein [Klebsiella grimontii]MDU4310503.1 hypothetical protein [Klebsiella michiganensis]TYG25268.1 hypothetical protein DJ549_14895 [Klebsiella grimontii]
MKTTLQKVKDGIAAMLLGKTPEQLADEQRRDAVKSAIGRFLESNPDWQPAAAVAPAGQPVTDSKQKAIRIMKTLGAGAGVFTPHVVDEAALRRACEAARAFQAADPERYGDIITAAPIKGA